MEAQDRPIRSVGNMLAAVKEARTHHRGRVQPNVIQEDFTDNSFIIPAAGNLQGGNGTYFRSDITLINHSFTPQKIIVGWLPANTNNCAEPVTEITLDAGVRHFDDFVGQTLGKTGIGTLFFMAVDDEGELDQFAFIDGFSRIWTPMPNGLAGTSSQQFAAIETDDLIGSLDAFLFGLRQDAGFRTNVGIVNFDNVAHSWTTEFHPSVGTRPADGLISVPPCSMSQSAIPPGNFGPLLVQIVPRDGTNNAWSAYGSSTDNSTGDGWIVKGKDGF